VESNTTADLQNAWASAPDDVFAVGWPNVIIHYDGTDWTQMDSGSTTTSTSTAYGEPPPMTSMCAATRGPFSITTDRRGAP